MKGITKTKTKVNIMLESKSLAKECFKYIVEELGIPLEEKSFVVDFENRGHIIFKEGLINDFEEHEQKIINYIERQDLDSFKQKDNLNKIPSQFFKSDLLENIYQELDKKHKLDKKEKLGLFIIATTSELADSEDRKSCAIKGDSSSGKDNILHTVFSLFPEDETKFLTHSTSAALRKLDLDKIKRIAFSEINQFRENGANSDITETFKQLAEGGIEAEICDSKTKMPVTLKSEQKSLFYGTTETASDEELATRYILISIRSNIEKNKVVVSSYLESISKEDSIFQKFKENKVENWVSRGIRNLDHDVKVIIPFANLLSEKIEGKHIFDFKKDRIKRDVKRLFSICKAITWLHQEQRIKKKYKGFKVVYAEPIDFIITLELFKDFFNLTYSNMDHRLQTAFDYIKENQGKHADSISKINIPVDYSGWVLRNKMQEDLGKTKRTIKDYVKELDDMGLIDKKYLHEYQRTILRVSEGGGNWGDTTRVLPVNTPLIIHHLISNIEGFDLKRNNIMIPSLKINSFDLMKKLVISEKLPPGKLPPGNSSPKTIDSIENLKLLFKEKKLIQISYFANYSNSCEIIEMIEILRKKGFIFESKQGVLEVTA